MTSHLLLMTCLFCLLLSLNKNFLLYLKPTKWRFRSRAAAADRKPKPPPPAAAPASLTAAAMAAPKWSGIAMLVIGMQNDFVLPEMGSPGLVAGAKAIVPAVAEAVAVARKRGIFVVWVVREHDPYGRDVELFRQHHYAGGKGPAVKGSRGAEIVDELVVIEGDYKLVRTRFSAFFATHLNSLLKSSGIKNLVIVGIQTPDSIRQTVFDAVALDYKQVAVIVDATAAATPEIHLSNIRDMMNIGVATPTLQEWCRSDA